MKGLALLFEVISFVRQHPQEIEELAQAFETVKSIVGEIKAAKAQPTA